MKKNFHPYQTSDILARHYRMQALCATHAPNFGAPSISTFSDMNLMTMYSAHRTVQKHYPTIYIGRQEKGIEFIREERVHALSLPQQVIFLLKHWYSPFFTPPPLFNLKSQAMCDSFGLPEARNTRCVTVVPVQHAVEEYPYSICKVVCCVT